MPSNPDDRTLERRLAAVERAVDGSEQPPGAPPTADVESLENRLDELESRVAELDAALQAVRGFLGGVDAVNETVESRADAAVAAVEQLERRLDDAEGNSETYPLEARAQENPTQAGDSIAADRANETAPETTDRELEESATGDDDHDTDEAAGESDRTLRERLSERW